MEIKYYDNKEEHGIIYDWSTIFKAYKKLKPPKEIYDPTTCPIDKSNYAVLMSIRSTGKTTAWLLIGLIMNQMYNTQTGYIRQYEDMTAPVNAKELLKVINDYKSGYYIKAITKNRWNSSVIKARRIYLCYRDEEGKVIDTAEEPWLIELSLDRMEDYKSTLNVPRMDLVIFDEFISSRYMPNEFVILMQLLSTILRSRKSMRVLLLANNTNVNHIYFKEFEISKIVKTLKTGDNVLTRTGRGTSIYVELIGLKPTRHRQEVNAAYFGFENPLLSSITGSDDWSFETVPHIVNEESDTVLNKMLRVEHNNVFLQAEFTQTENRGLIVNIHECTTTHKDSIILTLEEIWDNNHLYGFGHGFLCRLFWDLYKENKIYYDTNESGAILKDYIKAVKLKRI